MIVDPELPYPVFRLGAVDIDFSRHVATMAIVNRTPDSFYDEGATFAFDAALAAGARAFELGADIVDVGGVKFAPGPELPIDDELGRVVPFVRELAALGPVSVDTFHPRVARESIAAGAAIINDTTGLHDPEMASIVADSEAVLVIAHSSAAPRTRLVGPQYGDVVRDVREFLEARVALALDRGVPPERIIVDPGHDLNKNTLHTLAITRELEQFARLGYPLLVALSNKDFIGETLNRPRPERLVGSIASAVFCATQGARIVRVHNVAETVDAMRMIEATMGWRDPVFLRHNMPPQGPRLETGAVVEIMTEAARDTV